MLLDVIDVISRLERRFGIRIDKQKFSELFSSRQPPDATVAELVQFVRAKLGPLHPLATSHADIDRFCCACGYNLRGLDPLGDGRCPECGEPGNIDGQLLLNIRQIIAKAGHVNISQVNSDSRLVADLGMI